jgi:hypothetical protein
MAKKALGNSPYDESVFDYGSMTDAHKEAVKKCLELAEKAGVHEQYIEIIKVKFNLSTLPTYDMANSETWKSMKADDNLSCSSGGHTQANGMNYPYISIMADIRDIDKWLAGEITNLSNMKSSVEENAK